MATSLPKVTIKDLLEAGVHYGHKTMRWNPRMAPYLFGSRNGTHIIDLQQTAPLLHKAIQVTREVVRNNGRVLFVGTKRQASDPIAEAAERCGQYYVNHRWLGGMLTNWGTVSKSIKTLTDLEAAIANGAEGLKKKEILNVERKIEKLRRSLGGIMEMGGKPDLLFVIDIKRESIALQEAKRLGIPVIAILDSNVDPSGVDYPVPGNDDATRAIELYCRYISDAALVGIEESLAQGGAVVEKVKEKPAANDSTGEAKAEAAVAKEAEAPKAEVEEKKEDKAEETPAQEEKKPDAKKAAAKPAAKKETAAKAKPAAEKAEAKKTAAKKPAPKKEDDKEKAAKSDDKKDKKATA